MTDRDSTGGRRRRLEGVIPELFKRAVEIGVEKATEAPDNIRGFVNDMKLPKEIAHYLFTQVDDTKNGLFRVVAKEMRDFLEHTNIAGEAQKLLTTVQFEINTTIRFRPNEGPDTPSSHADDGAGEKSTSQVTPVQTSLSKPEVKTQVHVTRDGSRRERRRRGGGNAGSGGPDSGGQDAGGTGGQP